MPVNYESLSHFIAIPFLWDFCFIQQGIPRFRIFHHSIIPSNGVALLNSSYRISDLCSLHKFSGSFEHLSLIEMVKWSLFGWIKLFFKVSTMCRSNLFRYFGKEKVFFFNHVPETPLWSYFKMFIIYCSNLRLELKNYIFGSTGNNSLIQTVKCSLLN